MKVPFTFEGSSFQFTARQPVGWHTVKNGYIEVILKLDRLKDDEVFSTLLADLNAVESSSLDLNQSKDQCTFLVTKPYRWQIFIGKVALLVEQLQEREKWRRARTGDRFIVQLVWCEHQDRPKPHSAYVTVKDGNPDGIEKILREITTVESRRPSRIGKSRTFIVMRPNVPPEEFEETLRQHFA